MLNLIGCDAQSKRIKESLLVGAQLLDVPSQDQIKDPIFSAIHGLIQCDKTLRVSSMYTLPYEI